MTETGGGRPADRDDAEDATERPDPGAPSTDGSAPLKEETPGADEASVYDGIGGRPRMTWSSVTEAGGSRSSVESNETSAIPSSFRFDLGGALARLGGDEPSSPPAPAPPDESSSSVPPAEALIDRPDERLGASTPISPPSVEPTRDGSRGQRAADESLFAIKPLPTSFATGSTMPADRHEPLVDLSGLPPDRSAAGDVDERAVEQRTADAPDERATPVDQIAEVAQSPGGDQSPGVDQIPALDLVPAFDRRGAPGPSDVPVEAPEVDELPNYPRRIPGTHLGQRHVTDDPPVSRVDVPEIREATSAVEPSRARISVFDDKRVDRYDPSVRGRGIASSPTLPGGRVGLPTLPAANPAAPPPIVEPVGNSTSTTDMTALRSAQLKAQRQQRQGKLFGRSLIAFVIVGGLIAGALVFGRSLLFTTEWDAQLTPIVNEIEAERGASFDRTVALEMLDPTEFGDRLRAATIGDAWVDDVPAWRALNLTTGIVTAESVAAELAQDTLARYDADAGVILTVTDADPDEARADLRLALEAAYVAQQGGASNAGEQGASALSAEPDVVAGFAGVSPTMTIATRAVDNFLARTATTAERRAASETLPIPIAYQLAAVKSLGEPILVAAGVDPGSLSVGGSYPESIGEVLDDDAMTTASAILQPGERSLADPVALGNDDWSLVWSTRLPKPTVDELVELVVADSYRPIDHDGRTCVVGVFQMADEPAGTSVFTAISSWASAAPAASSAVASQLGPNRVQLEVCDPGAENGVAAPSGVADGLIDRQQLRLTN